MIEDAEMYQVLTRIYDDDDGDGDDPPIQSSTAGICIDEKP